MKNGKLGFAIIGSGTIAPVHANAIKRINQANLIAFYDLVEKQAKGLAEKYDCDYYTDYKKLLECKDIDVVNIVTPSGTHCDFTVLAANAGKHIIVTKPIEITSPKIDKMIQACNKAKVKLATLHQYRSYPCMIKLYNAIKSGKFGTLTLADVYVKWWRNKEYYTSSNWRGTLKLDGGGALMNQSIHFIDLLIWMLGPVDSISANCATLGHKIEVEDVATATVKFKNGAIGVIEGTTAAYPGLSAKIEIHGTKGTVIIEEDKIKMWQFEGEKEKTERNEAVTGKAASDPAAVGEIALNSHIIQISNFIKAVKENKNPVIDAKEGRKAVELVLAIYKSAKTGKSIKF